MKSVITPFQKAFYRELETLRPYNDCHKIYIHVLQLTEITVSGEHHLKQLFWFTCIYTYYILNTSIHFVHVHMSTRLHWIRRGWDSSPTLQGLYMFEGYLLNLRIVWQLDLYAHKFPSIFTFSSCEDEQISLFIFVILTYKLN